MMASPRRLVCEFEIEICFDQLVRLVMHSSCELFFFFVLVPNEAEMNHDCRVDLAMLHASIAL